MAVLSSKKRKSLPKSDFAGPNRSYPIEDKKHAEAALMLINKGNLTPAEKKKVRAKAEKVLNHNGKKS